MSIAQEDNTTPDKGVSFYVSAEFKEAMDVAIARQRTTLRDFCTRAIAEKLGIPVPGEEPEPKRRKTA